MGMDIHLKLLASLSVRDKDGNDYEVCNLCLKNPEVSVNFPYFKNSFVFGEIINSLIVDSIPNNIIQRTKYKELIDKHIFLGEKFSDEDGLNSFFNFGYFTVGQLKRYIKHLKSDIKKKSKPQTRDDVYDFPEIEENREIVGCLEQFILKPAKSMINCLNYAKDDLEDYYDMDQSVILVSFDN